MLLYCGLEKVDEIIKKNDKLSANKRRKIFKRRRKKKRVGDEDEDEEEKLVRCSWVQSAK